MPFKLIYRVRFTNGNLQPEINTLNWAPMQLSAPTPFNQFTTFGEPEGINLRITRDLNVPANKEAIASVYTVLPGSLPFNTRVYTKVTFDRPKASGIRTDHEAFPDEVDP